MNESSPSPAITVDKGMDGLDLGVRYSGGGHGRGAGPIDKSDKVLHEVWHELRRRGHVGSR